MDVTSLAVVLALVGQTPGDRYQNYTPPGGASISPPTYTPTPATPAYAPLPATAAPPSYPPASVPPDPLFTAAAEKRTTTTSAAPKNVPPRTVAPIATPVPVGGNASGAIPATTPSTPRPVAPPAPPTVPDSSRAVELVREAITIPQTVKIEGRGRTLYETLAPLGDRRRQLDAIVAYWKLATETAEYHYAWQQTQFLGHLQKTISSRGNDPATAAEIGSRLATAQAQLRESELRLYDAQYELAQRSWVADGAARPLTVDLPHTGSYKTQFDRMFGGGSPPSRALLLHRTLPMRQQVVNVRADGVWAAQNGYEQSFEAFQRGQLPAEEVLAALDDFRRQRSEFITAVRRYNEEIAEYALTAAPDGMGAATLVGMLIKNPAKPATNAVSDGSEATPFLDADVSPATFLEPTWNEQPRVTTGTPTLAPPRSMPTPDPISAPPTGPVPMPVPPNTLPGYAPPTGYSAPATGTPPGVAPAVMPTPATSMAPLAPGSVPPPITPEMQRFNPEFGGSLPIANAPAANPLRGQPTLAPSPVPTAPAGASPPRNVVPTTATNPYAPSPPSTPPPAMPAPPGLLPPFAPTQSQPAPLPQTRYRVHTTNFQSAMTGGSRAQQTQELIESLYLAREGATTGTAISLEKCLAEVSLDERPRVLAAYWSAAEQQARCRVWDAAITTLQQISPSNPRVQSALLAAQAERAGATIALEGACWRLTAELGRPLDQPWLMPDTLPHGGRYDTKSAAHAQSISADPQLQRTTERLPTLHETLQWRAEAVLTARNATQSAVGRLASQQTTAHVALSAVDRQARETCELLKTTTRYNLAIADYALSVLPATTPRDTLVGALVIGRNAVASRP